jgi:RNA polymerase sigma factor (sigma-70 family)
MVLEDLYAQHQEAVDTAVRSTCARWHVMGSEAEDLAAELRFNVLRNDGRVLRSFKGRSAIGTYLFTVLQRVARKWIRVRARQRALEVADCDGYQGFLERSSTDLNPETAMVAQELRRRRLETLKLALVGLPRIDRQVLKLRCEGLEVYRIAARLGISPKSAEHRLYRGVGRLRQTLNVEGADDQTTQRERSSVRTLVGP